MGIFKRFEAVYLNNSAKKKLVNHKISNHIRKQGTNEERKSALGYVNCIQTHNMKHLKKCKTQGFLGTGAQSM